MEMTHAYTIIYASMGVELGRRIVETYPPLHAPGDPSAPELSRLMRKPLPAQELAIMGCVKYLADHDAVKIVGECGTGKTFMAGAGVAYVAAHSKPFSTIVMCPPHLTEKWAREILITVPHAQTYIIEDLRNGGDPKKPHGVVEIQYINGMMTPQRPCHNPPTIARHGPQAVAPAAPLSDLLHRGQGEGQARLLLETRLRQGGARAGSTQAVSSTLTRTCRWPRPPTACSSTTTSTSAESIRDGQSAARAAPSCIRPSGRPTARRSSAWLPWITWAGTCSTSSTSRSPTRCTNCPAIPRRATVWRSWRASPRRSSP